MRLEVEVRGVDPLVRSLDSASDRLRRLDLTAAAGPLEQAGAAAAPRWRGWLAASVRADATPGGLILAAGDSRTEDYAAAVHARRPFLADTMHAHTENIIDVTAAELVDVVATIKGA